MCLEPKGVLPIMTTKSRLERRDIVQRCTYDHRDVSSFNNNEYTYLLLSSRILRSFLTRSKGFVNQTKSYCVSVTFTNVDEMKRLVLVKVTHWVKVVFPSPYPRRDGHLVCGPPRFPVGHSFGL